MHRRNVNIRQVHTDLCHAILFNIPANRFNRFQTPRDCFEFSILRFQFSSSLPYIKGNSICPAGRSGIQVHIIGHQEISCPDHCSTTFGIKLCRAKIRFPFRLFYLFEKTFILSCPYQRQITALLIWLCCFVQVNGNLQFLSHFFRQFLCIFRRFFHADP